VFGEGMKIASTNLEKMEANFRLLIASAMANRLISARAARLDLIPPYGFVSRFMGGFRSAPCGRTDPAVDKNLQNPVWWPILEASRTFFEGNF